MGKGSAKKTEKRGEMWGRKKKKNEWERKKQGIVKKCTRNKEGMDMGWERK